MKIPLVLRTIQHLRWKQLVFQVKAKFYHPKMKESVGPIVCFNRQVVTPISKQRCLEGDEFCFLNIKDCFTSWNQPEHGVLWAYNLNYMDWLNQDGMTESECEYWIDRFIGDLANNKVGLDPYTIALRAINWVKVFVKYPNLRNEKRHNSLYSQLLLLEKKLEYRLLGNHLLEDAYSLYIGAVYFGDKRLLDKAERLFYSQLKEQILSDGAHFEQSPMYHCILLDRLLDCINFRITETLAEYAERMLGHLESIIWNDGSIPLFNDAARNIAPEPQQIFDYAKRLGLCWTAIPMKECGYRKFSVGNSEILVDVGNIAANYQPGHTHADTFSYEVKIDGKPIIVDTGISTYNPTERRQYERSSIAHNCVSVEGKDSSEVWGGFRVGKRCSVQLIIDEKNHVLASHNGYGHLCDREFILNENELIIIDRYKGVGVSYIHLASGVSTDIVVVERAGRVEICDCIVSEEYNVFEDAKCLKIHFKDYCKYKISLT